MKSNFLCLCSVEYLVEEGRFINPGFNKILKSYSLQFDTLHVVGYCSQEQNYIETNIARNIYFTSLNTVQGRFLSFCGMLTSRRLKKIIVKDKMQSHQTTHVQLRIPSTTSLFMLLRVGKKIDSVYVAGDWIEAAYYNKVALYPLVFVLEHVQRIVLSRLNLPIVVAGEALRKVYSKYGKAHSFRSTTHVDVFSRKKFSKINKLIYVGTFEKRKRVVDLIYAMDLLVREDNGFTLNIVGGGGSEEKLIKKLVIDLGLENNIKFSGLIDDVDVIATYYMQADILVLPSLSEGSPRVLPEAMSYGVVPIAINGVSSNDYIIEHMKSGMLAVSHSPGDIAKNVLLLAQDSVLYKKCLKNIYLYAQLHTIDNELDHVWEFLGLRENKDE